MRPNSLECFMFFLFLIVSGGESTSVRDNLFHENDLVSSTNSNKSPLSIISPIDYPDKLHSCLYVPPDLPPCQFIRNTNTQRFYRSINYDNINSNIESNYKGHFTVYSLQGCLPSRLPFRMMLCKSKDLLEKATKIWKLYPFKIEDDETIESTFIFPQFDVNQWSKSMRLLREEKHKQKRSSEQDDLFKTNEELLSSSSMISFDNDHNDLIKSLPSSSLFEDNSTNFLTNDRKRRRRRRKKCDKLNRREIRRGSEFPYSKSIPFDIKKLSLSGRLSKFF
ncbi:PREDICTED: uncharacterized protein LOC107074513 [Polistes dominula]|uniref:Uncharacterized protein LOC107074513 n=1 Tax=Polistes dominula TaxID=743375 RepID=A0ABM1JGC1_POLDO|nr:PREDICTED: uncharacterized protein LOC107074513 [Polistes dominula]XP_015191518.1 PREDICTED: uncharacterized protein LOC107074513 [Polistes dominula]